MNRPSLLFVDDEPAQIAHWSDQLSRRGYRISGATNVQDAQEKLSKLNPDLIVIDIRLSDSQKESGITFAQELKRRGSQVPIVYLTFNTDPATVNRAVKTSPYGIISKNSAIGLIDYNLRTALRRLNSERFLYDLTYRLNSAVMPGQMAELLSAKVLSAGDKRLLIESIKQGNDEAATIARQATTLASGLIGEECVVTIRSIIDSLVARIRAEFPMFPQVILKPSPSTMERMLWTRPNLLQDNLLGICARLMKSMPKRSVLTISTAGKSGSFASSIAESNRSGTEFIDLTIAVSLKVDKRRARQSGPDRKIAKRDSARRYSLDPAFRSIEELIPESRVQFAKPRAGAARVSITLPVARRLGLPKDIHKRPHSEDKRDLVLVIEDNRELRDSMLLLLQANGVKALGGGDRSQALKLYSKHQKEVSVILMDIKVPGPNIKNVLKHIREKDSKVKVIAMSGGNAVGEDHFDGFIQKPFTNDQLLTTICSVSSPSPNRLLHYQGFEGSTRFRSTGKNLVKQREFNRGPRLGLRSIASQLAEKPRQSIEAVETGYAEVEVGDIDGDIAFCKIKHGGSWFQIRLNSESLRDQDLRSGDVFGWIPRDDGIIRRQDIYRHPRRFDPGEEEDLRLSLAGLVQKKSKTVKSNE